MEPTKANFDYVNGQLFMARTLIVSKYTKKMTHDQLLGLEKLFDKVIMQYLPSFTDTKFTAQTAFLPVLEKAAKEYYEDILLGNIESDE